jgi:hypothetical protein
MAKASRRATAPASPPSSAARSTTPPAGAASEERPTEAATPPRPQAEEGSAAPEDARDEPVVIQDPEPASMARAESDEAPESDGSLRELFWGED